MVITANESEHELIMALDSRIISIINLHIDYYNDRLALSSTDEEKESYTNKIKFYLSRRKQLYGF